MMQQTKSPHLIPAIITIILIVIFDLISKEITFAYLSQKPAYMTKVTSFFNLVTVWNPGVSFGILRNLTHGPIILTITAISIAGYLFYLLLSEQNKIIAYALAMIIGGAIGNSIDRMMNGAVADFLDFHIFNYHWPAFNLADSFITIGVILYLIIDIFFNKKNDENK